MRIFFALCVTIILSACSDRDQFSSGSKIATSSNAVSTDASVRQNDASTVDGASTSTECLSSSQVKSFAGAYAKKAIWERLPLVRDWSALGGQPTGDEIDAVVLISDGQPGGIFGWHEAASVCVQFRGEELWARTISPLPDPPARWEGPYVFLGNNFDFDRAYFDRIFQEGCYSTDAGEKWCFGPHSIQIGTKRLKAVVHLDRSEMPDYGTPVSVDGEKGFWIFVPSDRGWKVFKDSFVSEEGHVDIDPRSTLPWLTLRPVSIETKP